MLRKRVQLGLIHVAVSMTLVPINSTLNRVMIKELAISATLVAILASLPYLFSPIQVAIGSFSDRHPLFEKRRTPYIVLGLLLCVIGVATTPYAAYLIEQSYAGGLALSIFTFGAWGMGYNFATVSYFSLASEISGAKERSRTIAIMFIMMVISIIFTATTLGRLLSPYSPEALIRAFGIIGGLALILGGIGMVGIEDRTEQSEGLDEEGEINYAWSTITRAILRNRQATLFFWYLILMLAAILGQDILLEPYGAEAFNLSVETTTRITSIWGTSFLVSMAIASALERRTQKRMVARIGAWTALTSFALIVLAGSLGSVSIFYTGVVLLGIATGLATVSNLSLMLDMTTVSNVGLFIGAWGMASAMARLVGNVLSGVVRDVVTGVFHNLVVGYQVVFVIEGVMLFFSLIILRNIDVSAFQKQASEEEYSVIERSALAGEL